MNRVYSATLKSADKLTKHLQALSSAQRAVNTAIPFQTVSLKHARPSLYRYLTPGPFPGSPSTALAKKDSTDIREQGSHKHFGAVKNAVESRLKYIIICFLI